MEASNRFKKEERLCSKATIEALYANGKSVAAYPLRAVYLPLEADEKAPAASILIAVSKKRFKHATDRNLVKRRLREAYRLNKHILVDALHAQETPQKMALAFIWLDSKRHDTREVAQKVKKLLHHIAEDQQ
jgi:ribonuclease P protein component